jgi:hypothetical protein
VSSSNTVNSDSIRRPDFSNPAAAAAAAAATGYRQVFGLLEAQTGPASLGGYSSTDGIDNSGGVGAGRAAACPNEDGPSKRANLGGIQLASGTGSTGMGQAGVTAGSADFEADTNLAGRSTSAEFLGGGFRGVTVDADQGLLCGPASSDPSSAGGSNPNSATAGSAGVEQLHWVFAQAEAVVEPEDSSSDSTSKCPLDSACVGGSCSPAADAAAADDNPAAYDAAKCPTPNHGSTDSSSSSSTCLTATAVFSYPKAKASCSTETAEAARLKLQQLLLSKQLLQSAKSAALGVFDQEGFLQAAGTMRLESAVLLLFEVRPCGAALWVLPAGFCW